MSSPAVLDQIIGEAMRRAAGALHFLPERNAYAVRLRIGTAIVPCTSHPTVRSDVVAELSRRASLDHGASGTTQTVDAGGALWKIVSTQTIAGPHVDLRRVLGGPPALDRLGFTSAQLAAVSNELTRSRGATLLCGPPSSGTSSTFYAALAAIDRSARVVVTLEDPIERRLDGVAQRPWRRSAASSHDVVRSVVAQNPDVVGIGTIDDGLTATIAMELAACGIKVLATMAATSASLFAHRLVRMANEPFAFVPTVRQVVCQRVLRVSCEHCAASDPAAVGRLRELGITTSLTPQASRGCARCEGSGFSGTTAIFEILDVTAEIVDLVLQGAGYDEIDIIASGRGMITLRQRAAALVTEGRVSVDEALRVL
jgi:type II secretory ATPase GspE/PulE/Tfp pilus assembly ATPase PilB-like protein